MIKEILLSASKGDIDQALSVLHGLIEQGHSVYDLASSFSKILGQMGEKELAKERTLEMMKLVSELRARILEGLATELQLGAFLSKCSSVA